MLLPLELRVCGCNNRLYELVGSNRDHSSLPTPSHSSFFCYDRIIILLLCSRQKTYLYIPYIVIPSNRVCLEFDGKKISRRVCSIIIYTLSPFDYVALFALCLKHNLKTLARKAYRSPVVVVVVACTASNFILGLHSLAQCEGLKFKLKKGLRCLASDSIVKWNFV